jgi:nicotinamidase/pyrazinamidase
MPECLIVVDVQNDFVTGGRLEVPSGEQVVPVVRRLVPYFDIVVASRDWHPENHVSFAVVHPGKRAGQRVQAHGLTQTLWPVHCVANTPGSAFVAELPTQAFDLVIEKGQDPEVDSYSAFFDNGKRHETPLRAFLEAREISSVHVCGLATNVCVRATALDARQLGLETRVILDACRGVELEPGDVDAAIEEMKQAGVRMISSDRIADS